MVPHDERSAPKLRVGQAYCYAFRALLDKILDEKYRIIRKVGAGGMGSVFEAEQLESGEHYAIKIVTPTETAKDSTLIRRFQPYMVMELLKGEDMSGLFRRGGMLSADLTMRIAAQVLLGLEKAHGAGIVHRDIKPANIYLSRHANPKGGSPEIIAKVLDFGVAKMVRDQAISTETGGLTRTGSMIGSPLYMSPEQARGSKVIDERADIWSLGIVLFEALTGRTPYQHIDALGELILAICSELPPVVQDYAPWVPKELASVIHRALSLDVSCRPQTARAFLDEVLPMLPDGYDIDEDMLVTVDASARSQVAPRLQVSHAATALSAGGMSRPGMGSSPSLAGTDMASSDMGLGGASSTGGSRRIKYDQTVRIDSSAGSDPGIGSRVSSRDGTHQGVTHGVETAPRGPRSVLMVASVAALVVGGVGAYILFRGPTTAAAPPDESAAMRALEPAAAASPGEATLSPTAPQATPAAPEPAPASAEPSAEEPPAAAAPTTKPVRQPVHSTPVRPAPPKPTNTKAASGLDTEGFGDRK